MQVLGFVWLKPQGAELTACRIAPARTAKVSRW